MVCPSSQGRPHPLGGPQAGLRRGDLVWGRGAGTQLGESPPWCQQGRVLPLGHCWGGPPASAAQGLPGGPPGARLRVGAEPSARGSRACGGTAAPAVHQGALGGTGDVVNKNGSFTESAGAPRGDPLVAWREVGSHLPPCFARRARSRGLAPGMGLLREQCGHLSLYLLL